MLYSFYQNYANLFEDARGVGFLGVYNTAPGDLIQSQNLAQIFIFSDMLAYVGIVVMVLVIGARYSKDHGHLTALLVKVSGFFCYFSLLINIFGVFSGWEVLSACSISIFSGLYIFNLSTQLIKILLLLLTGALYAFFPKSNIGTIRTLELPLLMQITLALSVIMISAANFALILLALEGFSLTLYIMTALGRTYGGITASVKYFAFGTLGSIFLFWGVVHIYSIIPTLSMEITNVLLSAEYSKDMSINNSLDFATTAIAFGFMIKLGAAPAHQWVADVYAGVHFYITAYFSVFVKCVLFLIFLRAAARFNCDAVVIQFTVVSLLVGCFMSVNQTEIKRLLAYSSIVHVGFLFMGDATSSIVYLLTYLISSLVIFSVMLNTEIAGKELIYMNDLRFIRTSSSFNVFSMVVALASSAGLPPFAGFYGKFLVWTSLIEDIYLTNSLSAYFTLFISVAITLITIFYYMRVIAYLFIGQDQQILSSIGGPAYADFYGLLFSMQGVLMLLIIFWSFVQPYVINVGQSTALFF